MRHLPHSVPLHAPLRPIHRRQTPLPLGGRDPGETGELDSALPCVGAPRCTATVKVTAAAAAHARTIGCPWAVCPACREHAEQHRNEEPHYNRRLRPGDKKEKIQ